MALDTVFGSESAGEGNPATFGAAERLARTLMWNSASVVMGLEYNATGTKAEIIIGLDGNQSEPARTLRTDADALLMAQAYCQTSADPGARAKMQSLIDVAAANAGGNGSPFAYIHPHGELTSSGSGPAPEPAG